MTEVVASPSAKLSPGSSKLAKQPADPLILYVSNLPHEVSEHFVHDAFYEGAQLEPESVEVLRMGMPHGHKKTCGLAVVKMKSLEDVANARDKLDGRMLLGRPMIIRNDKFVEDDPNYYHGKESEA
uniref:RRM domain-containing protein n=1 Tax=Chlamydomonas euryale TaxID=1486919 RepID=A0A7R9VC27_9CHLO|mmetsp:Transcript_27961/g.82919  ORF Transcript_27961/g.82919 Transcript_27961/m.82919 type:complete len:126 (+) Transcript_27961:128-505(+)